MAGIVVGIPAGLLYWARWLGSRDSAPRALRLIPWAIGILASLNVLAAFGAGIHVMAGVSKPGIDPAMKSMLMADGIAEGMNCVAFGATLVDVGFLLTLVILTLLWRFRWRVADRT